MVYFSFFHLLSKDRIEPDTADRPGIDVLDDGGIFGKDNYFNRA